MCSLSLFHCAMAKTNTISQIIADLINQELDRKCCVIKIQLLG